MARRTYRIRNLAVASLLAVAAAILTAFAAARAGTHTAAQAQPLVTVLVATRDLAVGTSATAALAHGDIAARRVTVAALAKSAATSDGDLRGRTVIQPIYAGEQLTLHRLGSSGAQGVRSELQGALRLIRVPGDSAQLLAGTVREGDHVDVVAHVDLGDRQRSFSRIVLRDLLVLEAPSSTAEDGGGSPASQPLAITLRLTDEQVERLFYAMQNGRWSLVLRPTDHAEDGAGGRVLAGTLATGR